LHGTILPIIFAIVDDVQHVVIAATMSILLLNSKIVSGVPAAIYATSKNDIGCMDSGTPAAFLLPMECNVERG
jgi:hypothetical protein